MRPYRLVSSAVLAGLMSLAASGPASSQAPAPPTTPPGTVAQPAPKTEMAKDTDKEKAKEKDKPPEWPKQIGGKDPAAYVKELTDPDPHIRNLAFQTLPKFGPDAQSVASKAMVKALDREIRTAAPVGADTTVVSAAINAIAELGLVDADIKDGCRLLGTLITDSPNRTLYRQYAIPALANFGRKAENGVTLLTASDILQDRSYEIRRLAVSALTHVGMDEHRGPTVRALEALTGTSIKDVSAAVRVEAFQTLVLLGPPVKPRPAGDTKAPEINKEMAARYMPVLKAQLAKEKDQQVECWARVAIMRFDPEKEINPKSLADLGQIIVKGNSMAKFQALNAISLLGERAEKQLNTIVNALQDSDPVVLDAAVKALVSMPYTSKQVLPELKSRLEARPEEYFKELLKVATKIIEEAKAPGTVASPTDPKTPPKK